MKRIFLALIALHSLGAEAATGCLFVGQGEARISAKGETKSAPLRLADCDGAKIESGVASVCFLNQREERTCRTLSAGDTFSSDKVGANKDSGVGAFKVTLVSLLKGDSQTRIGAIRKTDKLQGFPYENVLGADGDLVIHLVAPKAKALKTFSLRLESSGKSVASVNAADDKFVIPAAALTRGETFSWEAKSADTTFDGAFRFASAEQASQLRAAVAALAKDPMLDETGKLVLQSELYFEKDFPFDALAIMNGLEMRLLRK